LTKMIETAYFMLLQLHFSLSYPIGGIERMEKTVLVYTHAKSTSCQNNSNT
jgi:hypothetical protein